MSEEEKASVIDRLVKGQTKESRRLIIENRVKNNWTPNTKQALEALSKCKKDKDWIKEHPNFFGIELFTKENGELYYKGIPWNEFKNKFISNKNIEISQLAEKVNGFIQITYREQNSTTWENKSAFERVLQEKGVHWFVYIKFYIDEDKSIKPIVIGKSGSKYVTVNGSDVSFDYLNNTNDFRPARMFLKENNLDWYKESIIIIPCESQQDALNTEKRLAEELNLFES